MAAVNLNFNQFSYDSSSIIFQRLSDVEKKINEIAKRLDRKAPPVFTLLNRNIAGVPSAGGSCVKIPYLFLIKTEDIPDKLKIKGIDDPRLQSDSYLQEVAHSTQEFMGLPKSSLNFIDKETLRVFLKYISDPVLSEKAKEFVLSHEVSHIHHEHSSKHPTFVKSLGFASVLIIAASLTAILGFSVPFFIVFASAAAAFVTTIALIKIYERSQSHAREKEADLTALKASPQSREGGIYLFETFQKHQQQARKNNFLSKLIYSPSGNNRLLTLTHPTESDRIRYLKNAK